MKNIIKNILKEEFKTETRDITEISIHMLHKAADSFASFAEGLRYIESAIQFAYQTNNEDMIRDLEKLRMTIQSGGNKVWAERDESMNIVNRINEIIKKYS
jgi:hypothetical protein